MKKTKGTALRIILKFIDNNLFCMIEGIDKIAEIWDKLRTTYLQVDQEVIYTILNELFKYTAANKAKGYIKSVNTVFEDIESLIERLKSAV